MILVFGGTTEGRKTVEALEEAGSLYYYSTLSDGQQVELLHGMRLEGAMDVAQMVELCSSHDIRLLVDAAHPFAENLHRNLLCAAAQLQVPIIRYDRIYPPRNEELLWCKDYTEAMARLQNEGIGRLLALTGVNNMGTLRPYWQQEGHECWFRIMNRPQSLAIARKCNFPEDHLVYYHEGDDDTAALISQLRPQAILTKESGQSGGYTEKVKAALRAGVKVVVIERPAYPPPMAAAQEVHIERVDGPYGLRRAVERLLPGFFPLRSGLTTGTCATAAAVAATLQLRLRLSDTSGTVSQETATQPAELPSQVPVALPNGETITVDVGYGRDYAYCTKEAGDDPDVTNGIEIRASVEPAQAMEVRGGEGVGRFTLPGFDYPPGEPAINRVPRQMISQNLAQFDMPLRVTIAVPRGEEIARRTFNPRLGIEGGISIIGISGIVKPFSEEAFIESIHKCIEVALASGTDRLVINSGAKSERFVKERYPALPQQAFVQYGNYIGDTLAMAYQLGFRRVTLGVMLGKAVKLAEGQLDTHSRRGTMNKAFIEQMLSQAGCPLDISAITLARELWSLLTASQRQAFAQVVKDHCASHCQPLMPQGELTLLLIDDEGEIY